ncbi:MAG: acyltransferase [Hyphomonas sp.]|nr:acyltransferase [Hyphomonas sp.]
MTDQALPPAASPLRPAPHRFVVLDGLRGVAALLVISDHIPSALQTALPGRALAVDFFFVLSGFVLAHAYSERLGSGLSPFAFMRARFIRLYPLYIVASLLGVLSLILHVWRRGWVVGGDEFAVVSLFALTFLPCPPLYGWTNAAPYPFVGPAWSLFFELVANLVFALLAPLRRLRVLAIFLPIAGAVMLSANFAWGTFDLGWNYHSFAGGFPRIAFGFFAGVFIHELWLRGHRPSVPVWVTLIWLAVIAGGSWFLPESLRTTYNSAMQIVVIPLLVFTAANSTVRGVPMRVCTFLGKHSYGVYLLHVPIIALSVFLPAIEYPGGVAFSLAVAGVALGAAWIVYEWIDAPARAWLARRLG